MSRQITCFVNKLQLHYLPLSAVRTFHWNRILIMHCLWVGSCSSGMSGKVTCHALALIASGILSRLYKDVLASLSLHIYQTVSVATIARALSEMFTPSWNVHSFQRPFILLHTESSAAIKIALAVDNCCTPMPPTHDLMKSKDFDLICVRFYFCTEFSLCVHCMHHHTALDTSTAFINAVTVSKSVSSP